jgi:hypothetical protein
MASSASAAVLDGAPSHSFDRVASACALAAAVAGIGYAVAFVVVGSTLGSGAFLLLGGVLGVPVLVALYERVRATEPAAATCALVLGVAGTVGAAIHGGYDLANALHPPANGSELPNAVDPRGLLTFGFTGLSVALFAWLIRRGRQLPAGLGTFGWVLAALLVELYAARLVILEATNPAVALPALVTGFLVNPAWYAWLGLSLRTGAATRQPG